MIELDVALFRSQFLIYSDPLVYTDALIEINWTIATCYVSDTDCGNLMGKCRQYALNLVVAHLFHIGDTIANGGGVGAINSASEGTVSVSLEVPDTKGGFQYWLGQTPYGVQLLALLKQKGSVGIYVGGSPVARNFRGYNGRFK